MTDRHIQTWLAAGEWIKPDASPIETLTGLALVCLTTDCPRCLSTYARVVQVRAADKWKEHGEWWVDELCYQLSTHTGSDYFFGAYPEELHGTLGVWYHDEGTFEDGYEALQIHENDRPYHVNAWQGGV